MHAVMLCSQAWDYILHYTWPPWRQPLRGLRQTKPPPRLKAATLLALCSQHKALGQQTCHQSPKLQNDFATLHWRRSEHKAWGRPAGWFTCGNDAQHIPRSDFARACIAAKLVCLSRMMSARTAVVWPSLFCVQLQSTLAH